MVACAMDRLDTHVAYTRGAGPSCVFKFQLHLGMPHTFVPTSCVAIVSLRGET